MAVRQQCGTVAGVTRKERITYLTGLDMFIDYDDNSGSQSLAVKLQLRQVTACLSAQQFLK